MRFDFIKMLAVLIVGLLLAWGAYELAFPADGAELLASVIAGAYLLGAVGLALNYPDRPRSVANARLLIYLVLVVLTALDYGFAFISIRPATLIIPNALVILITMLFLRGILSKRL